MYAIWYLFPKVTNTNHNLKHRYLKLKSPFLDGCKSDPCLPAFLKASEGLVSSCPEQFLCFQFHKHFILGNPWAYMGPVKKSEQSIPFHHLKENRQQHAPHSQCACPSITYRSHIPGTTQHRGCAGIRVKLLGSRAGLRIYSLAQLARLQTIFIWGTHPPLHIPSCGNRRARVTNSGNFGLNFLPDWKKSQLVGCWGFFKQREKQTLICQV